MRKIFMPFLALCFFSGISFAQNITGETRNYKVGEVDFVAIKDIDTNMGKQILLNPSADVVRKMMPDNQNPSTINVFLAKTKNKTVLFDTGTGTGGSALKNLKESGVNPENIDIIIITHMHSDHIGGLLDASGAKAFVNADVYISQPELEYWLNNIAADVATSSLARSVRAIYGDKIKTFEWGDNIVPEIKSIKAPGHTPGHTIFEISSKQEKLLVVADIIHSLKVQMTDPSMSVVFDVNPKQAAETRKQILREVEKSKTRIAGMHIPFPGIGNITEPKSGIYLFVPSVR